MRHYIYIYTYIGCCPPPLTVQKHLCHITRFQKLHHKTRPKFSHIEGKPNYFCFFEWNPRDELIAESNTVCLAIVFCLGQLAQQQLCSRRTVLLMLQRSSFSRFLLSKSSSDPQFCSRRTVLLMLQRLSFSRFLLIKSSSDPQFCSRRTVLLMLQRSSFSRFLLIKSSSDPQFCFRRTVLLTLQRQSFCRFLPTGPKAVPAKRRRELENCKLLWRKFLTK